MARLIHQGAEPQVDQTCAAATHKNIKISWLCATNDNAQCHSELENAFLEDKFTGAQLLWLAPYSAPLNPLEEVLSGIEHAESRDEASTGRSHASSFQGAITGGTDTNRVPAKASWGYSRP